MKKVFRKMLVIAVAMALGIGFAAAPAQARVSLSGLQADIAELQQQDIESPNQLIIRKIVATSNTLDIYGANFGTAPTVTVGGITATVQSATDSYINAVVGGGPWPESLEPGTYMVTVSSTAAPTRSQFDAFEVTTVIDGTIMSDLEVLGDVTIGDGSTKTTLWLDFESDHAEIDNSPTGGRYPWVASATNECQTNEGACFMVTEELPSTSTSEFSLNIHCFNAAGCTLSYDVAYSVGFRANVYEVYYDEDGTSDITDLQGVFGSGTSASASSCSPTILDACWKTRTKSLSLGPYTMILRVYSGSSSSPKVLIDNIKMTNGKGTGDLHVYGQISAQLNKNVGDVAEYVPFGQPKAPAGAPLPGSIAVISDFSEGSDASDQFSLSRRAYEDRIAGVISWSPSVGLNAPSQGEPLALTGRLEVRVSNETGPIRRGDPITSSSIAGVGMKAERACRIVGFALENSGPADAMSGVKEVGTVLVHLQVGYWDPGSAAK